LRITSRSSLDEVAASEMSALRTSGIRAVLTGGACATLYTGGAYHSEDVDVIIQSPTSKKALDGAMATIGFRRRVDRFEHPSTPYFVEFPRGPLSIGDDTSIVPVERRIGRMRVRILSATDSCRDRLAAFYHWRDRQSLATAIAIALRNRVDLRRIAVWSEREGARSGFEEFSRELRAAKRRRHRSTRPKPHAPMAPRVRAGA
jgi:hypothetical protein